MHFLYIETRVHHAARRRGGRLVFGCSRGDCEETPRHRHVQAGYARPERGIAVSQIIF